MWSCRNTRCGLRAASSWWGSSAPQHWDLGRNHAGHGAGVSLGHTQYYYRTLGAARAHVRSLPAIVLELPATLGNDGASTLCAIMRVKFSICLSRAHS